MDSGDAFKYLCLTLGSYAQGQRTEEELRPRRSACVGLIGGTRTTVVNVHQVGKCIC
jgi:hypothetical protein